MRPCPATTVLRARDEERRLEERREALGEEGLERKERELQDAVDSRWRKFAKLLLLFLDVQHVFSVAKEKKLLVNV